MEFLLRKVCVIFAAGIGNGSGCIGSRHKFRMHKRYQMSDTIRRN